MASDRPRERIWRVIGGAAESGFFEDYKGTAPPLLLIFGGIMVIIPYTRWTEWRSRTWWGKTKIIVALPIDIPLLAVGAAMVAVHALLELPGLILYSIARLTLPRLSGVAPPTYKEADE